MVTPNDDGDECLGHEAGRLRPPSVALRLACVFAAALAVLLVALVLVALAFGRVDLSA